MVDPSFQLIGQGAEARLYKGIYLGKLTLVKERFRKTYRHEDLDEQLNKERIKAEARTILKCKIAGIRTPAVYLVDMNRKCIFMEYMDDSVTVKDYIASLTNGEEREARLSDVAKQVGSAVGRMHAHNLIHGDLTTSNMLLATGDAEDRLVLIDFGLSVGQATAEDKAVDLYVLERALLSTHADMDSFFPCVLASYRKCNKDSAEVLRKLDEVRSRGRKRTMIG
ncbi:EKC/KEOPS complex subunit Tp53rkb isoform X1 [Bacillus rossius redtenbacheri]|uniref:EKC/KEOPS complex subunit Tp53rkb isoform X1 n=2 Tax=Bacillus rossius redtenbacheri TaxID=93214 RepID=UPI002FDCB0C2